ncbi:retroviral-like aspartic protease family protein [Candidatus Collierbacteria bacterium]|nr:retroviral-like aspartic protease family protein [Candidatus Collierbacteria bacterium]
MDKLSFPFQYSAIPYIGRIFTPIIPIKLKTVNGVAKFNFLVDTGADLTTLPHFMASRLGIDLSKEKQGVAEGLGGFRVKTWLVKVDLILPDNKLTVRASITDENSTPFLLGRVDLLDVVYSWNFSVRQKQIIFEPI